MVASNQPVGYGWTGPPPDPTNVIGRRIGAFFIDAAIVIFLFGTLVFLFADNTDERGALRDHECTLKDDDFGDPQLSCNGLYFIVNGDVRVLDVGPAFALSAGVGALFYVLLPALTGASIGKHATGLRVVAATGAPAAFWRHLVRWLFLWVDGPMTFFICGLVTSLVSKGHRRVGDMVAGTFVVGKASMGTPIAIPGTVAYAPQPTYAPPPGVGYGAPTQPWGAPPTGPTPPAAPPPPPGPPPPAPPPPGVAPLE
ncbi:MAG: RDD family protein [Acidimicrobiales bacterium]